MGFARRLRSRRALVVATVVVVVGAVTTLVAGQTNSFAAQLEADDLLLPGTTIGGVHVGGMPVDVATDAVARAAELLLDQPVTISDRHGAWEVTPRDLGATTNADSAVLAAERAARDAGWLRLASMRWAGSEPGPEIPLTVDVPVDRVTGLVDTIADRVDAAAVDARLAWTAPEVTLITDRTGRQVDRPAAVTAIRTALEDGHPGVMLPVDPVTPAVRGEDVRAVLPEVRARVAAALARPVTLRHEDRTWEVRAGDVGGVPDLAAMLADALQGSDPADESSAEPLSFPDGRLGRLVDRIAGEVDVAPRDAALDWSSGWIQVVPEQDGLAIDLGLAERRIAAALADGRTELDLPTRRLTSDTTTEAFHQVLLLRQDERRLYLYAGGEIVRDWPVAVGQGGSPTPTGQFSVGAKRFEPTWYNPAPDDWGRDMPAIMGPGPDNPLGARAVNWNRNGVDTLIRFHGTPNERSIGQAASRGCVRMYNADVMELYDLVSTGTAIVSITG